MDKTKIEGDVATLKLLERRWMINLWGMIVTKKLEIIDKMKRNDPIQNWRDIISQIHFRPKYSLPFIGLGVAYL